MTPANHRATLAAIRLASTLAAISGRPPFAVVPFVPRLRGLLLATSGQWATLVALSQEGICG